MKERLFILFFLSLCGCFSMKQNRVERRLGKGNTDSALKLAKKVRERQAEGSNQPAAEELYQQALLSDIVAKQSLPRLHFFVGQFPNSTFSYQANMVLLEWSMAEAENYASEAVFQGLARQYSHRREAKGAAARAETLAYNELELMASATDLHSFLLRYPNGRYSDEVRAKESDIAFMEADHEDTVPAWRDFIRRYPDHESLFTAEARLRSAAWRELSDSSTSELWAYAAEYAESEEGWKAANRALQLASWYQGDQKLDADYLLTQPISKLVFSLGAPPAPGHKITLRVDVREGDEWVSAADWAIQNAAQLGIDVLDPNEIREEVRVRRDQLQWSSSHAICSSTPEPVTVRLCSQVTQKERRGESCQEIRVNAPCHGVRELIFLSFDDDLAGPVGHLIWNKDGQLFEFGEPTLRIPDDWACTHVSAVDSLGAEVGCGRLAMRLGWESGHTWLRQVDPNLAMVERVDLASLTNAANLPLVVDGSGDLYDRAKKMVARSNGRTPVRVQQPTSEAFAPPRVTQKGAPSLPPTSERPMEHTNMILPEGAQVIWGQSEGRKSSSLPPELMPFFGVPTSTPRIETAGVKGKAAPRGVGSFAVPGLEVERIDAPIGPNGVEVGVYHVRLPQVSLFLIGNLEDAHSWKQMLVIPGTTEGQRSEWVLFKVGDSAYLRTMGLQPTGVPQSITLRWSQGMFHVDTIVLGHGGP